MKNHSEPVCSRQAPHLRRPRLALIALVAAATVLAACGDKKEKGASQTAAKVNSDEITVHQINFLLQQQRGLRPDQADEASQQVLERLIDQQLAVQKADEQKLDRLPGVVQQLDATKRDILARAYFEKIADAAVKPTAEEVKKYYNDNPALFKERRIFNLQEIAIESKPEQEAALREKLAAAKNVAEFVDFLKAGGYKYNANQASRPAEQLPLQSLNTFAKMQDGQAIVNSGPNGIQVIILANSRSETVSEELARPAIEQFLTNERKRKLIEDNVKVLRAAAKIEYVGKFGTAASAPAGAASAAPAAASASASAAAGPASGSLSAGDISKGMGLKK
jgi:EpsD family peptidyl-prolyl cis-trans isomerase